MGIIFADSFDHYTDPGDKWDLGSAGVIVSSTSRTGSQSLRYANGAAPTLNSFAPLQNLLIHLVVGGAWKFEELSGRLWTASNAMTAEFWINVNADGSLSFESGTSGILATTPAGTVAADGLWYYIETSVDAFTVDGTLQIQVTPDDGSFTPQLLVDLSGLAITSVIGVDGFSLDGPAGNHFFLDDFYLASDTFKGPVKIYCKLPEADSATVSMFARWQPDPGVQFDKVNEVPPDAGATEIFNTMNNLVFTVVASMFDLDLTDIPSDYTVVCVQGTMDTAATSDSGPTSSNLGQSFPYFIRGGMESGALGAGPSGQGFNDGTYHCIITDYDQDPITGLDWVLADLLTTAFGCESAIDV